ncbi:hypothetical protein [Caulobacter sp.]|uniref:hypothetical protein n=1 Tax=Caulobacter sp. TaxID=78 RepID=UPI001B0315F7|nr:hypothetical protein [Caulobacter sp.]MBO9544358.1 hypothetical protein [Caulobacter sp.]
MFRRALIHALVAPIVANVLLLAVTFVETVVRKPGILDQHVDQATELLPKLLTTGHGILLLGWAILALIGMVVADTRRPRTVLGVIRLSLGGVLVGGAAVFALVVYGLFGVPVWIAICAATLAVCRLAAKALGAGLDQTASRSAPDPVPESRAVFGRRGLT